ncbi:MAG: ABC transporter substrate-binding protein [Streptosporangiaceae bacterium]|nr:ABC transporter substrate-binding protein [Streptosporangiaceae bacterium]
MKSRIAAQFAVAAAMILVGAGCTSSSSVPSGGAPSLTHVSVGVLPIIDNAPVFIALQRGLFHQQGLDVTPVVLPSGELATEELLSGKLQFAFSNYVTTIQAASQGAKLQVVADGAETLPNTNVIMIAKGSAIHHVQDLRGKTIAVNARGNIGSLMIDSALETYGVPVNSVRFTVIPFPQMAAALGDHSVDAAWMAEPFVTESGEQIGAEELADTTAGAMADFPIAGYDALRGFAQQHPATVAAFQRAIVQAQALAADRSVVEKALPTYIDGMTPPVISAVHLDSYPTSLSQARLQRVANTMLLAGMLRQSFSVNQLLAP